MAMLAGPSRPSAFAVLRNHAFTLLWSAQLISGAGSALTALAAILIYRRIGSALSGGVIVLLWTRGTSL
jgi:hypothetical protein